ncbi:max-binding protein MNT-like isoform X2 [Paramacrobiotus metropolitanus]|nr:max-binding protein MNT-like isoform X2 [Paramacrobiotus metropolitanus]
MSREKEKAKRGGIKPNTENRSVHNVLEKNRRAHLKDCFESLKHEVMETDDEKKASHLAVLKSAVRCIQQLQKQSEQLQRDHERVLKEKTSSQQRFIDLKREVMANNPCFDVLAYLHSNEDDADSQATCTAPGSPAPLYKPSDDRSHTSSQQPEQSSTSRSTAPVSPSRRSAGSSSPPERSNDSNATRKKSRDPDSSDSPAKSRRPPIKSVTEILRETSSEPTASTPASPPVKSPASAEGKKVLPIKLRILQDQQDGMFLDRTKASPVLSPISPALETHLSPSVQENCGLNGLSKIAVPYTENMTVPMINNATYWPDHNLTAFPFYARSGFPMSMFPMNQFLVPVSNGTAGQIPHVVMMPALGSLYGQQVQAAANPPRSDSPSSS